MALQLNAQQETSSKQAANMTAAFTAIFTFATQKQQQTASLQAGLRAAEQAAAAAISVAFSASADTTNIKPTCSIVDVQSVGKPTTFNIEEANCPNLRSNTAFFLNGLFPGAFH